MADPPGLLQPPPPPGAPQQPQDPGFLGGLLGGGGLFSGSYSPAAMYGGQLTDPATIAAFRSRALAAMANAFGQGAMPVPYKGGIPIGATIGSAANAAATAGDPLITARTQAMQGQLYGAQAQNQLAMIELRKQYATLAQAYEAAGGPGGAGGGGTAGGGPGTTPAPKLLDKAKGEIFDTGDPQLNLIAYHESGYRPNVGTGGQDLSGYQLSPTGFPMWEGIPTKLGRSTAAGLLQITRTTWDKYAPALIASGAMQPNFSVASQIAVGKAIKAANPNLSDWLPFNANLREAYARGDVIKVPGGPGSTEVAAAPVPIGATGAPEQAGTAAAALGRRPLGANAPLPVPPAAGPGGPLPQVPDFAGRLGPPGGLLNQPPPAAPPGPQVGAVPPGSGGGAPAPPPLQAGGNAAPPAVPPGLLAGGALANTMAQQRAVAPQMPAAPPLPSQNIPPPPVGLPPNVPRVGQPAPPPAPPGGVPGLMQQQGAPTPPPPPPGPPGALGMPPGGMPMPGIPQPTPGQVPGAPTPRQVAIAQQMATLGPLAQIQVPPHIADVAKFGIAAATAQATAAGTAAGQFPTQAAMEQMKAQYQVWAEQQKPQIVRPGSWINNPYTQQREYNPPIVQTTDPKSGQKWQWYSYPPTTPDGVPRFVSIGPGEIGPRTKEQEAAAGRVAGQNEPQPQQQPQPQPGAPAGSAYQGVQLAPNMFSKQPDYAEPAYTGQQLEKNTERWGKLNGELAGSIGVAQQGEQRLTNIANAFQQIQTGKWTTDKADWNMALDAIFGQNGGPAFLRTATDPGAVMTALHETYRATLQTLKAANPRFANAEFQGLSKMSENPDLPPAANLNMLSEDIAQLRQQRALAQDWTEARIGDPRSGVAGKQDPEIFQAKWLAENQLPAITEAVKKEIGIGKLAPAADTTVPMDLPQGSKYGGTSGGRPYYILPNGQHVQVKQ